MNQLEESKEQNELLEFRMFELEKTYEDAEEQLKKKEERIQQEIQSKVSSLFSQLGLHHLLNPEIHQNNGQLNGENDHDDSLGGHVNVSISFLSS